jgi:PTS system nitrogen regulatory IIA component
MPDVLTLKQLAEHLQLSERTIYRLLGRGQLPGFKLGGHWRFRRSVVDYWLDLRMGRLSPVDLRELGAEWPAGALSLSDALMEANALLPVAGGSRREIIDSLVHAVTFPEPVDAELVATRVWEREQLASTATEGGVAFLHTARWDSRTMHRNDLLAIGRLDVAVDFGAMDGGLTDVLLLLLARDARQHLILLAKAAQLCREPGFLGRVRDARSGAAVVTLVRNAERVLFSSSSPTPPS